MNLAVAVAVLALLLPAPAHAEIVDPFDISVYGTQAGGGALASDYDFSQNVTVSRSLCAGGLCLYSSTDPGFITRTESTGGLAPLAVGTQVALEIVALDDGVTVKVDATVLDAPGEMAVIGTAPSLHLHPEWQVTRPEAELGTYMVAFRFVQMGGGASYEASPTYTLRLTNGASPTPTPRPSPAPTPPLPAELVRSQPRALGDQLLLYYDARDGFTTFLNLANDGTTELEITLALYGGAIAEPFEERVVLPARGTRTVDVGALRGSGLPAEAGLAVATARAGNGGAVVSRALAGSFTVANLRTRSAWGGPALARLARTVAGGASLPARGTPINGRDVVLEQLRPEALDLSVYYDPASLQPVADGGNQLVFVSFADLADGRAGVAGASTAWDVRARRNDGTALDTIRHQTSGVAVSDLASIGGAGVSGAAGGMRFVAQAAATNRWIFFSESLGTFATGYALPTLDGSGPSDEDLLAPHARGDQLLLHWDARDGYTTFLNVANQGSVALTVRIALYGADLAPAVQLEESLAAGATRTVDVGALRADGLPAQAGIALVTAVADGSLVTSRALAGSFTVANLATSSAWGAPAAARLARTPAGGAPPGGAPIGVAGVALQSFASPRSDLAVYYDPLLLEPADRGGNQLVMVSFDDAGTEPVAAETRWRVVATRNDGSVVSDGVVGQSGVVLRDLVDLAGPGVEGATGRLVLEPQAGAARNRLAFFVQSLGTFATGYRLPGASSDLED
ncbi:MAG: hypothetical protein FJ148_14425 [Deltaproteobacteria bacterium]|nr:hypothetical protein [Deltaproteobacteria bacterium]